LDVQDASSPRDASSGDDHASGVEDVATSDHLSDLDAGGDASDTSVASNACACRLGREAERCGGYMSVLVLLIAAALRRRSPSASRSREYYRSR
jgi:hypothetical protein